MIRENKKEKPQPQEEWGARLTKFGNEHYWDWNGRPELLEQFISNLISKIRKEERELIIRIIEEEKEVIFNSEKFYNGGEEVFGLLLKIQEKIKHL